MNTIVLASSNQGKIAEIQQFFAEYPLKIVSQAAFGLDTPPETGLSFVENALLKARYVAQQTHLPALADDSGLVIDALEGRPGIYSARYAGEHGNMSENIAQVLQAMRSIPNSERKAQFCCVMAYLRYADDPMPIIAMGCWEGLILPSPQGQQGFGYDPIFYVPELACSAAELSLQQKNTLSHRGKALKTLLGAWHEQAVVTAI